MNQGRTANLNGEYMEKQIAERLISQGYNQVDAKLFFSQASSPFTTDKIFSRHCYIGKSIYETKLYTDIILYHPEKYPSCLAIEVKWQQRPGSVDEKYPFLLLNIEKIFPCPAILLLDGGGYKKGAETWIRKQKDDKFLGVFTFSEFMAWSNNGGI